MSFDVEMDTDDSIGELIAESPAMLFTPAPERVVQKFSHDEAVKLIAEANRDVRAGLYDTDPIKQGIAAAKQHKDLQGQGLAIREFNRINKAESAN